MWPQSAGVTQTAAFAKDRKTERKVCEAFGSVLQMDPLPVSLHKPGSHICVPRRGWKGINMEKIHLKK